MYKKTKQVINKQADCIVPDKWKEISDAVSENKAIYTLPESKKYFVIKQIVAVAACFCIVLGTVLFYRSYKRPSVPLDTNNYAVLNTTNSTQKEVKTDKKRTVITDCKSSIGSFDMKAPDPGEKMYSMRLRNAIEEHKEEDVCFLLTVSLHKKDGKKSRLATEEEKKAEYQRLISLGYELYETEAWTYEGEEGKKVYYPIVVGCYTEADLKNFNIDSEYGYCFDFVRNGDGSSISFDKCEKFVVKSGNWSNVK